MRRLYLISSAVMLLAIILAACAPKATPTPAAIQPPVIVTVVVTAVPSETPTQVEAEVPAVEPFNLGGPEMAVGVRFLYVDGSTLVPVPEDTYPMGRAGGTDNGLHNVTVSDFWIYRTEVTNSQYAYCVKMGKCSLPNVEDNPSYLDPARQGDPVTGVMWEQGRAYCEFVQGRYPTEAEWEMAAAWDAEKQVKRIYPWGDAAPTCGLLNFNNCVGKTTNVVLYPQGKSYYDLLDMAGNSYEWVADRYDPLYYRNSPAENPLGADIGDRRSIRSGGYKSNKDQMPSATRFFDFSTAHRRDLSFRCVVEDPTYFAPICELLVHTGLDANGNPIPGGGSQNCPDPVINHSGDCAPNNTVVSNVSVHVDAPSVISVITGMDFPGCNPGGNIPDAVSVCGLGISIHAEATCSLVPPPIGTPCPDGWSQVGDKCVSRGGPGEACLEGYDFDPSLHCCSATPGNPGQQCAAGFHEFGGVCVPDEYGLVPPSDADFTTFAEDTCGPTTGYGALLESSPLYIALAKEQGQPILAPVVAEERAQSPLASVSGILTLVALGLVGWITRYGRKRS